MGSAPATLQPALGLCPLGESGPIWPSPQPSFHFPGAAAVFGGCDLAVAGSQQAGLGCSGLMEP